MVYPGFGSSEPFSFIKMSHRIIYIEKCECLKLYLGNIKVVYNDDDILLPIFLKEEDQANEYDLSYNEIILFQLKMINYISNHQSNKILCLIELPLLTQEIDDYLKKMKNCINVVMIYKTNNPLLYRNIYLFDDHLIDLNDEQQIYNLYLNKGICTLQEAQQMIINNIKNKLDISITNQ